MCFLRWEEAGKTSPSYTKINFFHGMGAVQIPVLVVHIYSNYILNIFRKKISKIQLWGGAGKM